MSITNFSSLPSTKLELANRFKAYRLSLNYSRSYIAQKSGVSVGTIRSFEQTGTISLDNLIKILRTLSLAGNFEFLIPNLGVNSVDLHRLGHSKQRARPKKKNNEIIYNIYAKKIFESFSILQLNQKRNNSIVSEYSTSSEEKVINNLGK